MSWPSSLALCDAGDGTWKWVPVEELCMPVQRTPVSTSQLAELLGVEPSKLIAVERDSSKNRVPDLWWILLEPDDADK